MKKRFTQWFFDKGYMYKHTLNFIEQIFYDIFLDEDMYMALFSKRLDDFAKIARMLGGGRR